MWLDSYSSLANLTASGSLLLSLAIRLDNFRNARLPLSPSTEVKPLGLVDSLLYQISFPRELHHLHSSRLAIIGAHFSPAKPLPKYTFFGQTMGLACHPLVYRYFSLSLQQNLQYHPQCVGSFLLWSRRSSQYACLAYPRSMFTQRRARYGLVLRLPSRARSFLSDRRRDCGLGRECCC